MSLRAIDPEHFSVVDVGNDCRVLEEIQESQAFFHVYDGAVYLFQGQTYLCTRLDLTKKTAFVRSADLQYYTQLRDFTDVHVVGGSVAYPIQVGFVGASISCPVLHQFSSMILSHPQDVEAELPHHQRQLCQCPSNKQVDRILSNLEGLSKGV